MPQNVKQRLRHALRTYLLCVYIAAIIYLLLVIENFYEKNVFEKSSDQTWFAIGSIFFMGFMIFILVIFSPFFREILFRMFGAEETKNEAHRENTNLIYAPNPSQMRGTAIWLSDYDSASNRVSH